MYCVFSLRAVHRLRVGPNLSIDHRYGYQVKPPLKPWREGGLERLPPGGGDQSTTVAPAPSMNNTGSKLHKRFKLDIVLLL